MAARPGGEPLNAAMVCPQAAADWQWHSSVSKMFLRLP